jgi:hypothetical protein
LPGISFRNTRSAIADLLVCHTRRHVKPWV